MEELSLIHKTLLDTGASAKLVNRLSRQVQSLILVVVLAGRRTHDEPDSVDDQPPSQP